MTFKSLSIERERIRLKGLALFSIISIVSLLVLLGVSLFNHNLLPSDEIPVFAFRALCLFGLITHALSAFLATRGKSTLSFILFFTPVYLGCSFAIYSGGTLLQVQNSMFILLAPVIFGFIFVQSKWQNIFALLSLLLVDLACFLLDVNISNAFVSLVFFHLISFGTMITAIYMEKLFAVTEEIAERDAKLREVGFVAGAIAHEIKNPLAIVSGHLSIMNKTFEKTDDLNIKREKIIDQSKMITDATKRISAIIESMYSLIKSKQEIEANPLCSVKSVLSDLGPYIEDFKHSYGIDIQVVDKLDDVHINYIEVRSSELIQIICNLVRNACVSVASLDEKWVRVEVEKKNRRVEFAVIDSGPGLPEKVKKRLGESFNSGSSKGLGIGLAVSMALSRKNNCQLQYVESSEHACFLIAAPMGPLPSALNIWEHTPYTYDSLGHIFAIRPNLVVIAMRPDRSTEISALEISNNIKTQMKLVGDRPYHYIVFANGTTLSNEASRLFNSKTFRDKFLSGAIVDTTSHSAKITNLFISIFKLPYPVKMFDHFEAAYDWTQEIAERQQQEVSAKAS